MGLEPLDHSLLAVTGYTDRLSPRAGESVTVHASSVHPEGTLRLVRLGHDGKAFTKEEVGFYRHRGSTLSMSGRWNIRLDISPRHFRSIQHQRRLPLRAEDASAPARPGPGRRRSRGRRRRIIDSICRDDDMTVLTRPERISSR